MTPRLAVSLSAILLTAFLYIYGPALYLLSYTKWRIRNSPELWLIPKPLPVESTPGAKGPTVPYFSYQFESPLPDVKEVKKFETGAVFSFSDCAGMTIFGPGESSFMIQAMRKGSNDPGYVFGREATSSYYALRSKILNLTPNDLRVFSSRQEMAGNSVLVMLKSTEVQFFKNGLFHFETPWLRGFEEGDLSRDKGVIIEAYDDHDRQFHLMVGRRAGKTCFSQADVDHIIFSFRPVPVG
jgi:hypothetical protein